MDAFRKLRGMLADISALRYSPNRYDQKVSKYEVYLHTVREEEDNPEQSFVSFLIGLMNGMLNE